MLADVQGLSHKDDQLPARLAEAEPLVSSLNALPGMAAAGKIAAIKDTAEIDVLDLDVPLSGYRFHHLSRSGKAGTEASDPNPVG